MNWFWIALALTVPTALAVVIALPFWLKGVAIVGNAIGAGIITVAAIGLIGREYIELQRLTLACLQAGRVCAIHPEPFTRFAIYGFIGLLEICALFALSLFVEERVQRRAFAREWR